MEMPTKDASERDSKPSFAKVAAMAHAKPQTPIVQNTAQVSPDNAGVPVKADEVVPVVQIVDKPHNIENNSGEKNNNNHGVLSDAVRSLRLGSMPPPSKEDSPDHGTSHGEIASKHDGFFDDDETHLSNSSTKPTSLDSKSAVSTAAFPFDEKESLRPDDSASVQAIEEDESISGRASGTANSRVGSDSGHRPFQDQYREINQRIGSSAMKNVMSVKLGMTGGTEEKGISSMGLHSGIPLPTLSEVEAWGPNGTPMVFLPSNPDEKLLEAMESPKDRIFLLQLEEKVIAFVHDSKEPILDLPPSNSFCRLLTHKLADYYHLTHFVDNNVSSVRLFRTPYCRLPTPLSSIAKPLSTGNTPPPQNYKIMRRADPKQKSAVKSGDVQGSVQSGPSSDTGADNGGDTTQEGVTSPSGSINAKDRATLSREEREAKYKEARERIFKGIEESDPNDLGTTEAGADLSRSSSRSGKKKTKKHKNYNDDGFEVRSQYNAIYTPMDYSASPYGNIQGASHYVSQFVPASFSRPTFVPPNIMPNTGFQQYVQPNYVGQYSNVMGQQGIEQSYQQPYYANNYASPKPQNSLPIQQPSPRLSSSQSGPFHQYPGAPQQHVDQHYPSYYQNGYQQYGPQNQQPVHWSNFQSAPAMTGTNFGYGQYPNQPYNQVTPKLSNQHPVPGSFMNPGFNPQTKSFVPTNFHFQNPQMKHFGIPTNGMTSPPGRFNVNRPMQNNHQVGGNTSFGPPPMAPANDVHALSQRQDFAPGFKRSNPGPSPGPSSLATKWVAPAHLPPKPPPSEVSPAFPEGQRGGVQTHTYAAAIISGTATTGSPGQGNLGVMHSVIRAGP